MVTSGSSAQYENGGVIYNQISKGGGSQLPWRCFRLFPEQCPECGDLRLWPAGYRPGPARQLLWRLRWRTRAGSPEKEAVLLLQL